MDVGDIVELRIVHFHLFWVAEVVLGFEMLTGGDTAGQDLANEWLSTMADFWMAPVQNQVRILRLDIHNLTNLDEFDSTVVPETDIFGAQDGVIAPHNCAQILRWNSGLSGRSNHGRSYLYGFLAENILFGQFWNEAAQLAASVIGGEMLAQYGPSGASSLARFVIASRRADGAVRPTPVGIPITEAVPVELVGTQRRRIYNVSE